MSPLPEAKPAIAVLRGDTAYRNTLVGILATSLLLVSVVGWALHDSYVTAWRHGVKTSTNLVTALQRNVEQTVETYDLSLKAVLRGLNVPELDSLSLPTQRALLFNGAIEAGHMGFLFLLDASGQPGLSSGEPKVRPGSLADRDYFTVHRDRSDAGLFISKPFHSRATGEWSIALSRRINDAQGGFKGVVAGVIHFSYFAELFSKLDLAPGASINLYSLDGALIDREPFLASQIGRDFSASRFFQDLKEGRTDPYESVASSDGESRLIAFATVGRLPLVVSVGLATQTIYAEWYPKALLECGVSLVLLAFGVVLVLSGRSQNARRTRAEDEAVRSAQMLNAFFHHSPDALFIVAVQPDGRLTYEAHSRPCALLTGISNDEALGKQPSELFAPDLAAAIEQRYRTCIESGQTLIYEETRTLRTGRRDWHGVLCPVRGASGRVTRLVGSARDMTDQNRRDAEQQHTKKMEAVGRLTAGVAHDFNNYLQTITGSIETLIEDYLVDADAIDYAELARKAAESGARLTHRLLAFSRQQVLRPHRVSVAMLLGDTRKLVGSAGFGPDIHFKIAVEPFTDDIQVDPTHAESALLNLLFNARDAMPGGGSLVLHARNARPDDGVCGTLLPENIVIIAVHDSGSGMDEATRAKAFDPFFTTKMFGKGSGLGLSMVQGFCHQSGGEIRILSGGAVGTRVELWLPAASATGLAGEEISSNLTSLGRTTGRVLLVEDEHDVSLALSAALVSGGFEVVRVTNGRDGLARLSDRDPYDAILTDYAMPDMTGADFLAAAAARAPHLPMLMISGSDIDESVLPAVPHFVRLLRKPMRRPDLLGALREAIAETRLEDVA